MIGAHVRKKLGLAFASVWTLLGVACTQNETLTLTETSTLPSSFFAPNQVRVQPDPFYHSEWDTMKVGVLQHHDRKYTYDVVPSELNGGLLFRGIHRQPQGTALTLLLKQPASVYCFFHVRKDAGYTQLFQDMDGWERCEEAPQYDIHNGQHGWEMIMYRMRAKPGVYTIPRSTRDKGCFNLVFVKEDPKIQESPHPSIQ